MSNQLVRVKFKSRVCQVSPGSLAEVKDRTNFAIPPDARILLNQNQASLSDAAQAGDVVEFLCKPESLQELLNRTSQFEEVARTALSGYDPDLDPYL